MGGASAPPASTRRIPLSLGAKAGGSRNMPEETADGQCEEEEAALRPMPKNGFGGRTHVEQHRFRRQHPIGP